jgi:2-polyprenyl-3-methyl-5-hydroxy-6-metoxy-1,4-benzoquinol methylase
MTQQVTHMAGGNGSLGRDSGHGGPDAHGVEARNYAHRAEQPHTAGYLWKPVLASIEREQARLGRPVRIVDLGCGAGHLVSDLARRGYDIVGIEPSDSGVAAFRASGRPGRVIQSDANGGLAAELASAGLGAFDIVVSTEVVEHVYEPRKYAACMRSLLAPGGLAIVTTPYHGYWKNLLIALMGKSDDHFTALWDYGHIKFWSRATMTTLVSEQGFEVERFSRVGRALPALAKSMVLEVRRGA